MLLGQFGFLPILAENGAQGMYHIEHSLPDLIICDISLPDIGGLDILKRFNELRGKRVPFFIFSALTSYISQMDAEGLNADEYLLKPLSNFKLLEIINKHINSN
jgi:DNA-binding response OmpR family regulator